MPYTPTSPTLVLCSDLATYVAEQWDPEAPSAVSWAFFQRFGDGDNVTVPALQGTQVVFFPFEDYDWETGNRELDKYTHHVCALVVARYTSTGDATRDWVAQMVDFVHTYLVVGLRFTRTGPAPFNGALWTLKGKVQVCDVAKLIGSNKLFFALVHLTFEEYVVPGDS